jgi:ubiquinone/menaquinone biosynthesis C-methylase UbiE
LNKSDFFTTDHIEMLHIAPEQCFLPHFKKQVNLDYLTGDLVSPIADMHFDLHNIPLKDNRFDIVFCNHVLEHVEDDNQCMRELFRVMKPGGWGIFQVPLDTTRNETYEDKSIVTPEEREKHFWQKDHVRLYGLDYPTKLKAVGFEVEEYNPKIEISVENIERYRLNPEEILYIFRKPE